jgi:hypothetical protein
MLINDAKRAGNGACADLLAARYHSDCARTTSRWAQTSARSAGDAGSRVRTRRLFQASRVELQLQAHNLYYLLSSEEPCAGLTLTLLLACRQILCYPNVQVQSTLTTATMTQLRDIPDEIFVKILAHLDYKQILRARMVSNLQQSSWVPPT